jgi:hypothetical protein
MHNYKWEMRNEKWEIERERNWMCVCIFHSNVFTLVGWLNDESVANHIYLNKYTSDWRVVIFQWWQWHGNELWFSSLFCVLSFCFVFLKWTNHFEMYSFSHSHSITFTHIHTHSLTFTHIHSHSHTFTHIHSHSHSHTIDRFVLM